MTEEEMKHTWCPHARVATPGFKGGCYNRYTDLNGKLVEPEDPAVACNCIGSACSQWRWLGQTEVRHLPPEETPEGDGWVQGEMWGDGRFRRWDRPVVDGFCGLAGPP